jgi:hypothetical protein
VADRAAARVAAGPEGELVVLDPEARVRERAEVAGVVVVQVGQDHVTDGAGVDADARQRLDRVGDDLAAATAGGLGPEARVDDDRRRVGGGDRPDVVVHRHRRVVRVRR